ncbi:MAG TPA: FAD-dependent oxidoreductase [Candidatus Omnitrophota bacterium]|nr:FAD-dependent oxidoreductase [Candidatus Omnitrophota bacterium]
MANKKIIILGGGLAGLSAAWHLKQSGINSIVLEKEKTAGGLCRSKQIDGFTFDYDGHLLHFRNNYSLQLVKKLLKDNLVQHRRSAWIHNFGIFSRYPFQANLYALPKTIASECLWGFIHASNSSSDRSQLNFSKWINATFGKGMAKHFMIPYNRKFWTVPLDRMSCPWSDKFIPQPSLVDIVNGFFADCENSLGYNAVFWYPKKGGIAQLPLALEKQVGGVLKNCCVNSIDLRTKEITIEGKGKQKFDILIMTIPLPELVKIIKPLPESILNSFKKLRWNSIFNLNLGVDKICQNGKHWVYFPHQETSFFRVGFFHNFSGRLAPKGRSSLYAEVSYSKDKPIDRKKITRRIVADLRKVGVISKKSKILVYDTNDIKYGYPIYDKHYVQATSAIKNYLLANNIVVCGRYGSWQYLSMEDALLDGRRVAEGIRSGELKG